LTLGILRNSGLADLDARWEQGSSFHQVALDVPAAPERSPWGSHGGFFGSGRDALHALVEEGRQRAGWKRLWMPSYFCVDVFRAALMAGIAVRAYPDDPRSPSPSIADLPFEDGDVVLCANTFGVRRRPEEPPPDGRHVTMLEDHTHDPWSDWSASSDADYCFASLRKVLPLPDGAVAWSPRGHRLPEEPPLAAAHLTASARCLAAMQLKSLYLEGHPIDKDVFRALFVQGEEGLGAGLPSAMTPWSRELLECVPFRSWREMRRTNHALLLQRLGDPVGAHVVIPAGGGGDCPFSAILVFDSSYAREEVRRACIAQRIYPAVLWPLSVSDAPGIRFADFDLSRRLLSLHCDARYARSDLERVADVVSTACRAAACRPGAEPGGVG
jgi:hypothetical protein